MTTLDSRPNSALLVIDVQNGVVGAAHQRDEVIGAINSLVAKARVESVPVIWVQHSDEDLVPDTDEWRIVAELQPAEGELVVQKHYGDSFEGTSLEAELAERGVGRLVVTGAQTDACIRSTIHGAFTRGYDTVLVADAHTTEDMTEWGLPAPDVIVKFTNTYWKHHSAPGRTTGVVPASDVTFTA
ncbi:MAG TPA: isochorismatase family protein [Ilumatobacter sp.]|nr:isochorismatase family protein [Ilumatobacter sp.]